MSLRRRLSLFARGVGLRTGPLDWTAGEPDTSGWTPGAVEIIVPIHGAHQVSQECLASVACHTNLVQHRLTVVVDGDPGFSDEDVHSALGEMDIDRLEILRHESDRGFVASVNRAMAGSDLDVVLLNSDVLVTEGWLDKMLAAAHADDAKVATVTPFSNDATLCSLPEPLRHNELPQGHDVDSLAKLVERVSARTRPRLPTGVGMCLFIRRSALDQLGLFDEAAFGRGYGEETDFCFRALRAGWTHVLDDSTFVFHHGQKSFGAERATRVRRAERLLAQRHPAYTSTIDAFLRRDLLGHGPASEAVRRVRWELRAKTPGKDSVERFRASVARVLHLVHGWPPHDRGGTENYAHWLVESQQQHREVTVYARVADASRNLGDATEHTESALRVRLVVNNFTERNPVVRNALHNPVLSRDFERYLDEVEPDLVHVHHLAGHSLSLIGAIKKRGIPLVYQVQDWWALCARANLLHHPRQAPCPGPALGRCSACLPLTGVPPGRIWSRALYLRRYRMAKRALSAPDAFVMGSRAIRNDYLERGLLSPEDDVYVLPYGVGTPAEQPERRATELPIRFGCVGAVLPHKGLHIVGQALAGVDDATLDLWGNDRADPGYARRLREHAPKDQLRLRGRFGDEDKAQLFAEMDVLLMPSLGKESFGLVAREALAHGVPVVAARHGALAELFDPYDDPPGALLPAGDVEAWRSQMLQLTNDPEQVDRWRRAIGPVVDLAEHAEAMEQVYADVLSRRG
ncbi:MAG: glycosyltransferase [Thermoanaerobaculia bacterium]|nr:glycosyltransferase [Thermoanaerobaculia bacterium]